MSVLVRPKGSITGADRIAKLLEKPIFAEVVEAAGGVEALLAARVAVVEGDLADVPALPTDLDAVVHCAGDVSLRPAGRRGRSRTNVLGTRDLLDRIDEAQAESGRDIHYVHISTAYVAGRRRGSIPEAPVEHDVDLETELALGPGAAPGGRAPLPRRRRADQGAQEGREGAQPGRAAHRRRAPPRPPASSGSRTSWSGSAPSGPAASAGPTATRSPRRWASGSSRSAPADGRAAPRSSGRASSSPRSSARTRAGSRASRWPSR